jgi:hypothetical protein
MAVLYLLLGGSESAIGSDRPMRAEVEAPLDTGLRRRRTDISDIAGTDEGEVR